MLSRLRRWLRPAATGDYVLLASVGALCACLWLFLEIAEEVREGDLQPLEERIMRSLRSPDDLHHLRGPAWLEVVARDLSALGGTTVLTLVTAIALGYLLLLGRRRTALFLALAIGGGTMVSSLLKVAIGRTRPDLLLHLMEATSPSFPSGHSMLSSVVYLTLGALLARLVSRRAQKSFCILTALALSFLVGLSRVFLGVHYPSDVMAGWTAGIAWSLLCGIVASRGRGWAL